MKKSEEEMEIAECQGIRAEIVGIWKERRNQTIRVVVDEVKIGHEAEEAKCKGKKAFGAEIFVDENVIAEGIRGLGWSEKEALENLLKKVKQGCW